MNRSEWKRDYYAKNREKICLQERLRRETKRKEGMKAIGRYVPEEEFNRDFKEIPGYKGYYANKNGEIVGKQRRSMVGGIDKCGYATVVLNVNGKFHNLSRHRLIAITFLEKPEGKDFVNHKDGIKTNNNVDNLEWVTKSENTIHSFKNGLQKTVKGHPVLTAEQIEYIRDNMGEKKDKEIAKELGCCRETVGCHRRKIQGGINDKN